MKVAIMQPYFMPYVGYFQLISAVDLFIVYDNIKYTKKGWINRNRILQNGEATMISLPLKSDSDTLDVVDRRLADDFNPKKLLAQIQGAYRAAPFFRETFPLVEEVLQCGEANLFRFTLHAVARACAHLSITTPIRISSSFAIDHALKGQDKVLALCEAAGAKTYVNPIGGVELYATSTFAERGVELRFLRTTLPPYPQFGAPFVPWLSIIDVLMFNARETLGPLMTSAWVYE